MRKSCLSTTFLCLVILFSPSLVRLQGQQKQVSERGPSGQMPPKQPFSASQWKKYTQELVTKILKDQPGSEDLIRNLKIKIDKRDVAYAGSDADRKLIEIFYGQIKLIDNEDEYIFVLAHELGHVRLQHKEIYILYGWTSYYDKELRRQEELEADEYAYNAVKAGGYNICAPFLIESRMAAIFISAYPDIERQSTLGILTDIFQSRLDAMRKHCESD